MTSNEDPTKGNDAPEASSSTAPREPPTLREDLISPAVAFLTSPKVRDADNAKKMAFLEQKGLTPAEIDEAFKRSHQNPQQVANLSTAGTVPPQIPPRTSTNYATYSPSPPTPLPMSTRRLLYVATLVGLSSAGSLAGLLSMVRHIMDKIHARIACYRSNRFQQYRSRLEKLEESVRQAKPNHTLEQQQRQLVSSLDSATLLLRERADLTNDSFSDLKQAFLGIGDTISMGCYSYPKYTVYGHLDQRSVPDDAVQQFKSEIRSFKGLLLSRRNFPRPNTTNPGSASPTSTAPLASSPPATQDTSAAAAAYHPRRRRSFRSELVSQNEAETKTPPASEGKVVTH